MKELNILDKFEFKFLSFELDPYAPNEVKSNLIESMAKKYYMPLERAKKSIEYINQLEKKKGLTLKMILVV